MVTAQLKITADFRENSNSYYIRYACDKFCFQYFCISVVINKFIRIEQQTDNLQNQKVKTLLAQSKQLF